MSPQDCGSTPSSNLGYCITSTRGQKYYTLGIMFEFFNYSSFYQLWPVLEIEGAILLELFTDGGDAEIGVTLPRRCGCCASSMATTCGFLEKSLVFKSAASVKIRQGSTHEKPKVDYDAESCSCESSLALYWLRVLILGARRNIPSAVWIREIPGARPSPSGIGCPVNPGRSAVG
jgi:hypothetical protein